MKNGKRKQMWLFVVVVFVLVACYYALDVNNREKFNKAVQGYNREGAWVINLDRELSASDLADFLTIHNYTDEADASFVASFLTARFQNDTLPQSVFALGENRFRLPAELVSGQGTETYRKRMEQMRSALGWNRAVDSLYRADAVSSCQSVGEGYGEPLTVKVYRPKISDELSWTDLFLGRKRMPLPGVVVRLDKHMLDEQGVPYQVNLGYAMTDEQGIAVFTGLYPEGSYSVLPIQQNRSFGQAKGTYRGTWGQQMEHDETTYSFLSSDERIRIFTTEQLRRMRDDGRLTVRTPDEYRSAVTGFLWTYLGLWTIIFCIGNTGRRRMDNGLAAALMAVMGLGVMFMFGILDPLTEKMTGKEMADGVCLGSVGIGLLMCFDIRRFFRGGYWIPFDPVGGFLRLAVKMLSTVFRFFGLARLVRWLNGRAIRFSFKYFGIKNTKSFWKASRRMGGWVASFWHMRALGYFILAAILTGWLFVAGQAVGGMKVNLNIFGLVFQPSEIVKYLLVVVMASWFFEKGDLLMFYSEPQKNGTKGLWGRFLSKYKALMTLGFCLSVLAVMYMLLSDLGPLLVLGLTFIVLMSLVKSRVPIYKHSFLTWSTIIGGDFGMLVVGAASFIGLLLMGHLADLCGSTSWSIAGYAIENKVIMAVAWLVGWVIYGIRKGQIWDSAIIFNLLVFLFIYGGDILSVMGFEEEALRFQQRNDMAMNPFGKYGDGEWIPTVNLQVAQALWAISTGGITGTGIGDTMAHFIPAGTTDLVLASLAETWGLAGVVLYMFLLLVILHRGLLAGYRSGHPFVLYLCAGIVIAGFIQFAVVSLGCVGLLPLTGVNTVFLSSGKVSLLMNALAFGIILSVSARNDGKPDTRMSAHMILPYRYAIASLCIVFLALMAIIVARMVQYQVIERDTTMVRGAVAYDRSGAVSVVYNPRIERILDKMKAGSVYDRNGIPVATGDVEKLADERYADIYRQIGIDGWGKITAKVMDRYYPVRGMEWMTGNLNTGYGASSLDKWPKGLMADVRFLSEMRGYDNIRRDAEGEVVTVALHSDKYKINRFLPEGDYELPHVQLRDYSPLLPFLKEGLAGILIERYNSGEDTGLEAAIYKDGKRMMAPLKPKDVYLTVDARLQAVLQQKMMEYRYFPYAVKMQKGLDFWKDYERRSIVIMDAERGEVLASVNPPVDMQRILDEPLGYYNDREREQFTAYTDMDLGLVYPTEPGSTAKIMTAMAMVNHMDRVGMNIERKKYFVHKDEQIHTSLLTANRSFGLQEAVKHSSNVWFIHAANELNLYPDMANIFGNVGVQIDGKRPYNLIYQRPSEDYLSHVNNYATEALAKYEEYMKKRGTWVADKAYYRKLKDNTAGKGWYFSWGQQMTATPLAMCRVMSSVAADGSMPVSLFRLDERPQHVQLVQPGKNLNAVQKAMRSEVTKNANYPNLLRYNVAGKTGTPERWMSGKKMKEWNYIAEKIDRRHPRSYDRIPDTGILNDSWYACYIPDCTISSAVDGKRVERTAPLAVAVRIERTIAQSDYAKDMTDKVVLPVLAELGYLK